MIMDIDPRDLPAPSSSTSTIGPIIGVVDGTDAAPGEVGEFLKASGTFAYGVGSAAGILYDGTIALLNVPPGDWDFWVSASFSTNITGAKFSLQTVPPNMSNAMAGINSNFTLEGMEDVIIVGQLARGSFAAITQLTFAVEVYQGVAGDTAGTMTMEMEARRRR